MRGDERSAEPRLADAELREGVLDAVQDGRAEHVRCGLLGDRRPDEAEQRVPVRRRIPDFEEGGGDDFSGPVGAGGQRPREHCVRLDRQHHRFAEERFLVAEEVHHQRRIDPRRRGDTADSGGAVARAREGLAGGGKD